MKLCALLVLCVVLCVVLCAADRRRSDRDDGAELQRHQHRHHDNDERRQHHRHDNERRQHHHHDGDDDNDDDEDDNHHGHGQERKISHLADAKDGSWRHAHDHDRRGRPDADGHGRTRQNGRQGGEDNGQGGQDGRRDREDGRRDEQEGGQERRDDGQDRRNDDRSEGDRHQEQRRLDGDRHSEHREHHGDGDRASKKSHGKGGKKAHPSEERSHGWRTTGHGAGEGVPPVRDLRAAGQGQPEDIESPLDARPLADAAPPAAAEEPSPDDPVAEALMAAESDAVALGGEAEEGEDTISPPPHEDVAAMARYVVHVSDWAAMATISTRDPTRGMPFANVFSVCDGTRYRSTGIPYLYLTDMEISVKDLRVNNNASLTMSLAQTSFCRERGYDPEDPLCAHVILSGSILQVDENDPEFTFARDALFSRHPEMSGWPAGHNWFVAKLDIQNIIVLDYFGGAKTVTLQEYFGAGPFKVDPRRANRV